MDSLAFYIVFDIITLFLLGFFSIFLLSLQRGNTTSHRLLAAFLIALALSYTDGLYILWQEFFYAYFPHAFFVGLSFELLLGPSLFFYIKTKTEPGFILRRRDAWHVVPFLLHVVFMTSQFHQYGADAKRTLLDSGAVFSYPEVMGLTIVALAHFGGYAVVALRALRRYRHTLGGRQAALKSQSLTWLRTVTVGFFLIWIMRFLNSMLWLHIPEWGDANNIDVRPLMIVAAFLFACLLVFKALRQPDVLAYEEKQKYSKTLLSEAENEAYLTRLMAYMERDKPYLDPSLDLKALADGIAIPPHHLSQLLNGSLNQNFFDFVNTYRIKETQAILATTTSADKRISEVMYEVGFNSKSVFNTTFKKQTGKTPSEFRKEAARLRRKRQQRQEA